MLTLRVSEVPQYLHDSAFYQNLNADDDESFVLMDKHFKSNQDVSSYQDLDHLLSTLQFWDLPSFPKSLVTLLLKDDHLLNNVVDEKYGEAFPFLRTIYHINQVQTHDKMNVAVHSQNFELILCLLETGIRFDKVSSSVAAATGSVELLKFIQEHGCELHSIASASAAKHGHLDCLKYLHSQHVPWHDTLGSVAAEGGHLECLIYAIEEGYAPANKHDMCKLSARNRHSQFFRYLIYHDLYDDVEKLQLYAADGGDPRCLQLSFTISPQWVLGVQYPIIQNKNLACFAFSIATGLRYRREDVALIARLGLLDHLTHWYNHTTNASFDSYIMCSALESGHFQCFKYMHECGGDINAMCHYKAAELGLMEFLVYMYEKGVPMSESACSHAALNGHIECLRYLHEHGALWDEKTCFWSNWRIKVFT